METGKLCLGNENNPSFGHETVKLCKSDTKIVLMNDRKARTGLYLVGFSSSGSIQQRVSPWNMPFALNYLNCCIELEQLDLLP